MRRCSLHLLALATIIMAPLVAIPTAQAASAATVGDCATQAAANPKGWYKSRYEWCKVEPLSAGEQSRGKVVGTFSAVYAIAVTTDRKSTAVHVDFQIKEIRSTGTLINSPLSVQAPCEGCTPGAARGRTASQSGWQGNPSTSFDFTGGLGTDRDKTATHAFNPRFVLGGRLVYNASGASFRCDNAYYINSRRPGCVFTQFIPRYNFSRTVGEFPLVGQHIYDALNHPASTLPAWRGKTIPGRLHRLFYDKARRTKNRSVAVATCKKYFPGYSGNDPRQDCDEFPFATTTEGAAKGDLRYSARPIDSKQNQLAGSRMNTWWEEQRVIEGDAFDVAAG